MPLNFNPFGSRRVAPSTGETREPLLSPEERDSNTQAGAKNTTTPDSSKPTSSILSRFTSPFNKAVEAGSAFTKTTKPKGVLDPSQKTKDALYYACVTGDLKTCMELIGKEAEVDTDLIYGITPLMMASEYGYEHIVNFLIDNNANLDLQDISGKTALMSTCSHWRDHTAEILIRNNANVDLTDLSGQSALHLAITHGCSKQVVGSLIKKVANLDLQDIHGETALHLASYCCNPDEIVQKLIWKGVRLDLTNKKGLSPLHVASQKGDKNTVAILVEAGANVDLVNPNTKETSLHLICARNVPFELRGYTNDPQNEEMTTKERKNLLETAKILIDHTVKNSDINAVDGRGENALFKASTNGNVDLSELLLKHGATPANFHRRSTQGISHEPGSAPRPSAIKSESTVKLNTPPDRTPFLIYRYFNNKLKEFKTFNLSSFKNKNLSRFSSTINHES